jgi:transposase
MSRYDLTDFEWRVIEPLLPNKPRGATRDDKLGQLPRHVPARLNATVAPCL